MAKTFNPTSFIHQLSPEFRVWIQDLHKNFTGGIDLGIGVVQAPLGGVNGGVYTQFSRSNGSGVLVRIAANGVAGTGAPYNWAAVGVGVVIAHGLQRQPIGFKLVDCDKDVRVFRTAAPDSTQITLASTDNTASVTVYIF